MKLERFVLFAGLLNGHTAIRYAAAHPGRVEALILIAMAVDGGVGRIANFEELAMRSWDTALMAFIGGNVRVGDKEGDAASVDYFRDTLLQDDFLAMARASRRSNIEPTLSLVQCPTLVVSGPMHGTYIEDMRTIAAGIPDARLVMLDTGRWMSEMYTQDGSVPPIVPVIDEFMRSLGPADVAEAPDRSRRHAGDGLSQRETEVLHPQAGLSARETEVLRLVAAGKSNAQIAGELVISQNTVIRHVSNIFAKIGAANRAEAASYATRHGIA
jgi:DNA-binding CsgD family transcriptional regulator